MKFLAAAELAQFLDMPSCIGWMSSMNASLGGRAPGWQLQFPGRHVDALPPSSGPQAFLGSMSAHGAIRVAGAAAGACVWEDTRDAALREELTA